MEIAEAKLYNILYPWISNEVLVELLENTGDVVKYFDVEVFMQQVRDTVQSIANDVPDEDLQTIGLVALYSVWDELGYSTLLPVSADDLLSFCAGSCSLEKFTWYRDLITRQRTGEEKEKTNPIIQSKKTNDLMLKILSCETGELKKSNLEDLYDAAWKYNLNLREKQQKISFAPKLRIG